MTRRRLVVVLLLLVIATGLGGPQAYAWYHLRAAEAALKRSDPDAAGPALVACKRVWGHRTGVLLLSSRAARQTDDFVAAERDLRAAHRQAGGPDPDVAFEWALFQAAAGNVWEVDEYLQKRADEFSEKAPLVWEALTIGYLRVFRTLDAMRCAEHWLAGDPDNVRALELRGMTFVTGKGVKRGSEDYRRVLELAPGRDRTRRRLVECLMDLGGFDEALSHIDRLGSADSDLATHLARCHNVLGRPAEARRVLDATLTANPDHGRALRTRGQFALADQQPAAAETWLRRAVAVLPDDYQCHWLLFQALQQQPDRGAEAQAQLAVANEVKDRSERLGELRSRKLAEQPLDPALHFEMGMLLLRSGNVDQGERWLGSSLALDPAYAPAHASLAALYERRGDLAKAADHRRRAGK